MSDQPGDEPGEQTEGFTSGGYELGSFSRAVEARYNDEEGMGTARLRGGPCDGMDTPIATRGGRGPTSFKMRTGPAGDALEGDGASYRRVGVSDGVILYDHAVGFRPSPAPGWTPAPPLPPLRAPLPPLPPEAAAVDEKANPRRTLESIEADRAAFGGRRPEVEETITGPLPGGAGFTTTGWGDRLEHVDLTGDPEAPPPPVDVDPDDPEEYRGTRIHQDGVRREPEQS